MLCAGLLLAGLWRALLHAGLRLPLLAGLLLGGAPVMAHLLALWRKELRQQRWALLAAAGLYAFTGIGAWLQSAGDGAVTSRMSAVPTVLRVFVPLLAFLQAHVAMVREYRLKTQLFVEDQFYAEEGLGRMVNLPLLARRSCLGTLNIGSVESGEPDPEALEFLRQIAIQVALAIENVQAYEQLTRLSRDLAKQNAYLTEEIKQEGNFDLLVGKSESLRKVLAQIKAVAAYVSTLE